MDATMTKIKREFEDVPEDNPDLVDIKQIKSLAGDPNNQFHDLNVKTELEEKNENDSSVIKDSSVTEKVNDNEGDVKIKSKTRTRNRTKVKCEHCGVMCRDKNGYKLHLMDHTGERPFKCTLCEKTYKKAMDLTYHMISHTGNHNHHCEACGKGFTVRSALKAHMRTHTKDKPYVCPVCGKGFSHSSSLKPHVAIHSDECPFKCDRCDRRFKTKKMLAHHSQTHDLEEGKGLQCGICFKFYKSKESIRIHLKIHRQDVKDRNQQIYSCGQCGNTYKHLISLRNHMRYHTNEMFECHMCDKSYVDKNHLRIHLRNHTGETPYKCDICNRNFRRRDSFIYHRATHDTNRKTYKCDSCDKVLVCKSSLRAHQTLIHSTEKKHQCQLCEQRFKMRYELTKHLRKHEKNGEVVVEANDVATEGSGVVCEICREDCGGEGLEVHMSKHDVKPLKCECDELFYAVHEYKKHISGCETVREGLDKTGQVFVKKEPVKSVESVKKECVD
ncbi:zinc finger protein 761-like [Anoplophora glabripennis]|uniref:zinc finger protein 761-like n=1 Tax=Anoplophora glabripennis TaxID=217634 RepID=UPI00087487C3|nr:zinc finger protein 761-like [Anoplophora glabripennis]